MAWSDPHDWAVNEVVTATLLDTNVKDNFLGSPHPVHTESTSIAINNSTTETSLFSTPPVIAANAMGTNGWVRVYLWGTYVHNASSTMTVRVKFGGTTIVTTAITGTTTNATARDWRMEVDVVNLASASVQRVQLMLIGGSIAGDYDFESVRQLFGSGGAAGAINTASNQTLDITIQWTALSASLTWTKLASRVMLMQA